MAKNIALALLSALAFAAVVGAFSGHGGSPATNAADPTCNAEVFYGCQRAH